MVNFLKYQNTDSPTIIKGIEKSLKEAPKHILGYAHSIGYRYGIDTVGIQPEESESESESEHKECVFSKTKSGKPTGITTGDKYTPDHRNPLDTLKARRALERALGIKSSNEFGSFIFGCGWDFLKAFEKTQGRKYIHNVILDQVAKELALWHKAGETRETVRPIISAFMFSSKAGAVTITPTSVFSPHTYETYKQKKLIPPKETAKKEWWQ